VYADPLDSEQLLVEPAQPCLELSPRRLVRGSCGARVTDRKSQPLGHPDSLDLPRRALRELVQEDDRSRNLERCEARGGELPQRGRTHRSPGVQYDGRRDVFTQTRMRARERDDVRNGWMCEHDLLDLPRRNLLAAAVDDLLQAAA